uniref:Putative NBS-LRR type disease resistance protein n=1 Tax=Oryza meyeriana var. granulata TaxID=110450 RepID=A0A1V1H1E3_9ORYZ|nr:putative NBS-LRR type disease resistance protein [Oryza meyeriana var. granulata]
MEGAIVSLTEGAVRGLLRKLGGILAQESWPVQRVHGEVQYIKDELESMNAFLRNLSTSSEGAAAGHDDQVRVWMKQVREIAYDAEDCIDVFVRRSRLGVAGAGVLSTGNEGLIMASLRRLVRLLAGTLGDRSVAVQLQELKARSRDAGERRTRYGVSLATAALRAGGSDPQRRESGRLDPRLHALFTEEAQLVAIDGPRDELVGWLMEEEPRLRVLAVVGFGGLGKTTLARMVCGSPRVKGADFQCSPLVIVSQTFSIRALFQHMLRELIQGPRKAMAAVAGGGDRVADNALQGMERWETAVLASKLREYLQDKRYIVILDDIWSSSAWESIKCAFPDNTKGSRIIVTTRNEDVANTCCCRPQDRIYKIQRLSDAASRELFFKRIFGMEDDGAPEDDELKRVSDSILKKCGGLPLAIVSIGSLLASKPNRSKEEWQKVCDNLGSELETNPTLEGTKQVLTLSYNELPYHLKACFLYLSIFPENHVIKRGPLVRMWIAEGFVTQRHGLSMEQVGERYFDEFVSRSMVHPVRIDWNGKVRSCRVHDIMLEVIVSKSLEENFASFFCDNGSELVSHDKIRRLSIHGSSYSAQRTSNSVAHVRTFRMSPSIDKIPFFFAQLRLLRVLDMQGSRCMSNKSLDCICRFFQLKYLSLRNTSVSILPRLIGNLNHLETLDIRETLIKMLPSSAANLNCLKHLLAGHKVQLTRTASVKFSRPSSGLEMSHGVVRNMANLQSLVHIEIKKYPSVFQEIGLLQNVRKLSVLFYGIEVNWRPFLELLNKLSGSVRSLSIDIFEAQGNSSSSSLEMLSSLVSPPIFITGFSLTGRLDSLPPWIASLRNVSKLTLRNSQLHADAIQVFGGLQNLLCLKLYHKSYADDRLVFPQGKFARVKLLIVDNLINLEKLHFEEGSVPNLERLTLSFLREPKDGISGLNNLLKLKEIEFFGNIISSVVSKVVSCVKGHPNYPRVVGDKWNIVTVYN